MRNQTLDEPANQQTGTNIHDETQNFQQEKITLFRTSLIKIVEFYRWSKAYTQTHKAKIYLIVTLVAILYSIFTYIYYRSNLICNLNSEWECMQNRIKSLQRRVISFAIMILTDCFIFLFYVYAFVYKKTSRILTALGIFQHIFLFFTGSYEMNVFNMMGVIIIAHVFTLIVSIILVFLAASIRFCCKKSVIITVGGLLALCAAFYFVAIHNQCQSWKTGINGEIQDLQGSCKMNVPMCSYFKGVSHIDYDLLLHNCFFGKVYKEKFNEGFSKDIENGTIVGYSDLKDASEYSMTHGHLQKTIFQSAKRYKSLKQARETMKHDVIFDTDDQRYYIQVLRNQTLAKEKDELFEKQSASSSPPLVKNVLFLFLDSISRFETKLKLPKLVEWFKKQAKYRSYSKQKPTQQAISQTRAEAYEFYKYHSLSYTTAQNLYPMFFGQTIHQMRAKKAANSSIPRFNSVHKDFSQRGFITSFTTSYCQTYGADIYDQELKAVINPIADHQTFSYSCDPNFHQAFQQYSYSRGVTAANDRCLYHRTLAEYTFQYTADFFDKYKNSSKFSQITLLEGHDQLGGSVKYIDNGITSFLEELQTKGHLQNTLVIAISDHGQHIGKTTKSISSDHYHPFLYIAVPQVMNSKYRDSIRLNQQNLITAYNIFHFLKHIVIGESYSNKELGLLGDLSFQVNCSTAKVPLYSEQSQVCYCQ